LPFQKISEALPHLTLLMMERVQASIIYDQYLLGGGEMPNGRLKCNLVENNGYKRDPKNIDYKLRQFFAIKIIIDTH
jgi:hypothetical protein